MIDRRIKFRHIQCFVEICREGSFKRAAEALYLTQPAVSKTLKELETLLGHRLLTRDRGGVALTDEGEVFLRSAKSSIAALQQGIDGMARGRLGAQMILPLGVLPSVAARLVPAVVSRIGADHPEAVLRIVDGPIGYLLERLKLGDLDLVVGRMGPHAQMQGVSFAPLYYERIVVVVRPGHPLLDRPALPRIVDWPVVYPTEGSAIRPVVDQFMVEHGIGDLPRRIETVSGAFGRVHVQGSDAVWFISEGVVANEIDQGLLVPLSVQTDTTLGPIGIMAREDWEFTPIARRFQHVLRDLVAELPGVSP